MEDFQLQDRQGFGGETPGKETQA